MFLIKALWADLCRTFAAELGFFANSWLALNIWTEDQIWVSIDFKWQKEPLIAGVIVCWNQTLNHFLVKNLLALIVQTFQIINLTLLDCRQNVTTHAIRAIRVHTPNDYHHFVWPLAFGTNSASFIFVVNTFLITANLAKRLLHTTLAYKIFIATNLALGPLCRKSVATLAVLIKSVSI